MNEHKREELINICFNTYEDIEYKDYRNKIFCKIVDDFKEGRVFKTIYNIEYDDTNYNVLKKNDGNVLDYSITEH